MARWESNARERLQLAALELFTQQGYENTTAAQIAERAGLAKSSFFRHFTDKREVLFDRQNKLGQLLEAAITAAPAQAGPFEAVGAALQAASAVFTPERLTWSRQRQAVIDATSELRERELLKAAANAATMTDALRRRGVAEQTAALAAAIGNLAFHHAFVRWIDPAEERDFAAVARQELDGLRAASAAL